MNNREQRAAIAQQTLAILSAGRYTNTVGQEVVIGPSIAHAVGQSVHFRARELAQLAEVRIGQPIYETRFSVTNETTLAAARRAVAEGASDVLCLNFASARNPGGGFLGGSEAQEENLAKSSALYPCIAQMSAMYEENRALTSCMYLDDMIYSPRVPVFRDDDYGLLDAPYEVSIVTAPAVNRGAVARNEPERLDEVPAVMLARMDKLLALALHHGHRTLVLGAWGCGVFANRADEMAGWFAQHLLHNPAYQGAFEHVAFAVLDRGKGDTFNPFKRVFGSRCASAG
jgi:uncharacterized protein (TIGR02452 family)